MRKKSITKQKNEDNVHYLPSFSKCSNIGIKDLKKFEKELAILLQKSEENEWEYTSYFLEKAIESLFCVDA